MSLFRDRNAAFRERHVSFQRKKCLFSVTEMQLSEQDMSLFRERHVSFQGRNCVLSENDMSTSEKDMSPFGKEHVFPSSLHVCIVLGKRIYVMISTLHGSILFFCFLVAGTQGIRLRYCEHQHSHLGSGDRRRFRR